MNKTNMDEMKKEIDHEWEVYAVCPHCGETDFDSWELGEPYALNHFMDGETGTTECGECGKTYTWIRHVMLRYETKKLRKD
jgi:hypothetical protein